MTRPSWMRLSLNAVAPLLCAVGFALLATPWLLAAAFGIECLAAAFWLASRAAADADTQLRRWEWLRRPATALWLAMAMRLLERTVLLDGAAPESLSVLFVSGLGRLAVSWAGLDLLGALPGARTFSDRTGPLSGGTFRMPALLPAAGALVFLRHSSGWSFALVGVDGVQVVLLVAAFVAVLRAYGRQSWTRALRWLLVAECAIAALLATVSTVRVMVAIALWAAACGGVAMWLVAEHRGASLRRDPRLMALWRLAGWLSTSLLAAPLTLAYLRGMRRHWGMAAGVMVVAGLVAWVIVRRPRPAPERRTMTRHSSVLPLNVVAALVTIAVGPASLAVAWGWGYRAPVSWALLALAPSLLGGLLALWSGVPGPRVAVRSVAQGLFRAVARGEHHLVVRVARLGRSLVSPLRDLHTGDAQEYLLFLVGLSVLMILLPILQ